MDSLRADRPRIDWLVLTAANARQAAAYDAQLAARAGHGVLAGAKGAFAVADARDARIGSGAATVLALVELARRLAATKTARGLGALFAGERILMLHSGGDSRRLPMYAVEGKLFAPVPRTARGNRAVTVFDLLLEDLCTLAPREGGETLVGAGDAVLGLARAAPVRFEGAGVFGVAQPASLARASRHGVFVAGPRGGVVRAFLQKPDERAMRAAGAVARDGTALVDLGLFSFDAASVAALLEGAGVRLARGRITLARGGLADLASRAELAPVDLYREIAMALPARTTRAAYLAACGEGALARPLGALFDAMRGASFRVVVADVGEFLHIGSMREMLDALVGPRARIRAFGVDAPRAGVVALDAVVSDEVARGVGRGRAVVDSSRVIAARLGADTIVAGIDGLVEGEIPRETAVFGVPFGRSRCAVVACSIDDDFKTPFSDGGTVFGVDSLDFARRARLERVAWREGDGTLWDARLWCVAPARDALSLVRWMWEGRAAPESWRRARKWSLRELVAQADLSAIAWRRAALAAERLSIDADDAAATDGSAALLASARLAAVNAEVDGTATKRAAMWRSLAFAHVGRSVLSRLELPTRPEPAAILHDQAVWTSMPVRVDLAGGWSDTPPICNEVGGAVVNVALTLRGQLPIQVVAKLEDVRRGDEPAVRITSTDLGETRVIRSTRDLAQRGDPTRWSSLAENALVLTGAAPSDARAPLARWLRAIGGGISLTMFSAVPKGSGLGTSSILGAATIHALDRLFGRTRTHAQLFAATSALEQMLGTRGGWQDQVGGVVGGFKLATTRAGVEQLPRVDAVAVPARLSRELASRSLLYFTGERRMAKNILENVVWNWLVREPSALDAVRRLRANAGRMRDALAAGDMAGVLTELDEYRACKRAIDPGSCPASFDALAERWRRELSSWCFAGAGGGGFMLLVARDERAAQALSRRIDREPPHPRARAFAFEVDSVGLRCAVL